MTEEKTRERLSNFGLRLRSHNDKHWRVYENGLVIFEGALSQINTWLDIRGEKVSRGEKPARYRASRPTHKVLRPRSR